MRDRCPYCAGGTWRFGAVFRVAIWCCALPLMALAASQSAASPAVPRIVWMQDAESAVNTRTREAFAQALAKGLAETGRTGVKTVSGMAGSDLAESARRLMARADVDLILVSGVEALRALAAENNGKTPVLALSPDCTAHALQGITEDVPENFLLFSGEFWPSRIRALHSATLFKRLGHIGAPPSASPGMRELSLLLATAANNVGGTGFSFFPYEDLQRDDAAGCREAVDFLFFDEVDALLLDGSGCFAPDRPDYEELMALLRKRGILPLSLTDPDAARNGALVSPWSGGPARLGRELAFFYLRETGSDNASANGNRRVAFLPGLPMLFSLNMTIAANMGFDPPVALSALAGEYVRSRRQ